MYWAMNGALGTIIVVAIILLIFVKPRHQAAAECEARGGALVNVMGERLCVASDAIK